MSATSAGRRVSQPLGNSRVGLRSAQFPQHGHRLVACGHIKHLTSWLHLNIADGTVRVPEIMHLNRAPVLIIVEIVVLQGSGAGGRRSRRRRAAGFGPLEPPSSRIAVLNNIDEIDEVQRVIHDRRNPASSQAILCRAAGARQPAIGASRVHSAAGTGPASMAYSSSAAMSPERICSQLHPHERAARAR